MVKYLVLFVLAILSSSSFAGYNIALIKHYSEFGNVEENTLKYEELSLKAISDGAQLLVFQEGAIDGYMDADFKSSLVKEIWCSPETLEFKDTKCRNVDEVAQTKQNSSIVDHWKLFSQRNNVHIMFTIPTKESGKYYNTAFVIGPKGIIKKHHKVIPSWTDMGYASAGTSETSIVDLPFGRFGILICRDGHSDSLYRYFSANGVKTYIGMGYGAVWEDYLFFTKDFNLNGFISDLRWSAYFSNTDGESIQNFGLATHVEPWPQVNNSGYAVFNENGKVLSRYFDLTEEERRFLNFNKP